MSNATVIQRKARQRRARSGDAARDQLAAGQITRRSRSAWGELPLVRVEDAHGPIINVRLPELDAPDYSRANVQMVGRTHEIANACLRIRADRLIDPVLVVERTTDGETWEAERDHPLLSLVRVPGSSLDTATFWRYLSICWDSVGAVYLEPIMADGLLVGVNPLDPQFVTDFYTTEGRLDYYEWNPGYGTREIFQPNQLIVRRRPIDIDPPPLMSALRAVNADQAFSDYIQAFFLNGGTPSGIIKVKGDASQDAADAIRAKYLERFGQGGTGQNGPLVLDDNADYQAIGSKLGDLDNETLRKLLESRIAMPFQVPPLIIYSYLGLSTATYSNLKEAWRSFWDSPVLPLLREWGDWLTRALLPFYETAADVYAGLVRARFDTASIPALQEDTGPKVAMFNAAYKERVVSANEYRQVLGLGPAADGAEGADEVGAAAPPEPAAAPAPPGATQAGDLASLPPAMQQQAAAVSAAAQEGKTTPVVRQHKAAPAVPQRLERDVQHYLRDQYAKARRLWIAGNDAGTEAVLRQIHDELDTGLMLFGILAPAERKTYADSWKDAAARINWTVVLDTGDVTSAVDILARRCVGIADTTKQEIADLIVQGASQQQTDAEIAAAIAQLGFDRSTARAPVITRTELATAATTAAVDAYTASGVVHSLKWLASAESCDNCKALDGKTFALGSEPSLPAHPACTCDFAPQVSEAAA